MIGDMHTHTHLSDGSMTREELVAYAKALGLSFIGITDHDTLMTKSEAEALSNGIEVIGGAEFSTLDEHTGRKVHILCFYPDNEEKLLMHCKKIQELRDEAGMKMAKRVAEIYPISLEDVIKNKGISKSVFKQHIMHALVERCLSPNFYGEVYKDLFGKNGKCYEKVPYPTVNEMLDLIHECGGVAILAHPKVYDSMELAHTLAKEHKIEGIECYHYSADKAVGDELLTLCKENDLIITGGSDFHGLYSSTLRPVGTRYTKIQELEKIKGVKNGH